MSPRVAAIVLGSILLCMNEPVSAPRCKYSVRDVGFVTLEKRPYRLEIALPDATTSSRRDELRQIARRSLEELGAGGRGDERTRPEGDSRAPGRQSP